MGRQHALGAAATWLAIVPALEATVGLTLGQKVVGTAVAVGGGMLPDLDQHGSTVSRTYGPITRLLARGIGALAEGHRNGTHSLWGLACFIGLALVADVVGGWPLLAVLWLTLGVGARLYGLRGLKMLLGVVVLVAAVTWSHVDLTAPLVGGIAAGAASHVALDMLTPQRCPLLWLPRWVRRILAACRVPVKWAGKGNRYGVGLVTTNSPKSSWLVTVLLFLSVVGAALLPAFV